MEKSGAKSNQDEFWKIVLDEADICIKRGLREDVSISSGICQGVELELVSIMD